MCRVCNSVDMLVVCWHIFSCCLGSKLLCLCAKVAYVYTLLCPCVCVPPFVRTCVYKYTAYPPLAPCTRPKYAISRDMVSLALSVLENHTAELPTRRSVHRAVRPEYAGVVQRSEVRNFHRPSFTQSASSWQPQPGRDGACQLVKIMRDPFIMGGSGIHS